MSENYSWYNGQIAPSHEIKISTDDLGFLRGYSLFDYFRSYNQKPFQWDWYWERFETSAKLLHIPLSMKKQDARSIVDELMQLRNKPEAAFRFLLTGGDAPDSTNMVSPNLLIKCEDLPHMNLKTYETGISIITHSYARDMPEIKSTDYKRVLSLQSEIKKANAVDVLYHTESFISEMSRSNVFILKNGKLKTTEKGVLKGITRKTVMALAATDFSVEETAISLEDVLNADEVFTTSTNKKVLGITKIDGLQIANGHVGPLTKELYKRFESLTQSW
jgi:branched-chain amino acid aminotransferase